jgi:hypothetical protein
MYITIAKMLTTAGDLASARGCLPVTLVLTDKEYFAGALDVNGAGFGFVTNNIAPPRTFGVEFSKRFQANLCRKLRDCRPSDRRPCL